jgi:hypothetical protein
VGTGDASPAGETYPNGGVEVLLKAVEIPAPNRKASYWSSGGEGSTVRFGGE